MKTLIQKFQDMRKQIQELKDFREELNELLEQQYQMAQQAQDDDCYEQEAY